MYTFMMEEHASYHTTILALWIAKQKPLKMKNSFFIQHWTEELCKRTSYDDPNNTNTFTLGLEIQKLLIYRMIFLVDACAYEHDASNWHLQE